MWWRNDLEWRRLAWPVRLAAVVAAAGLTAGCFQPLYGARPTPGAEGVQDKFAAIEIPPIVAPKGTPAERVAVGLRNALQFNLHNGGEACAPAYQLKVTVVTSQFTVVIDPANGRPNTEIDNVSASYQLVEMATGKAVLNDSCFAHVDFDIPGSEQRFAKQRAQRDAEDHAVQVVADTIRNRLASYFVAGT
jgi:LPS-assembly lipoprotein